MISIQIIAVIVVIFVSSGYSYHGIRIRVCIGFPQHCPVNQYVYFLAKNFKRKRYRGVNKCRLESVGTIWERHWRRMLNLTQKSTIEFSEGGRTERKCLECCVTDECKSISGPVCMELSQLRST